MSSVKQVATNSEVDERLSALLTNGGAIRAIASAVEGTIGPKGLDTMLVDKFGNVIVTNDGVTILEEMDVNHPAARMLINIAKAQEEEIGDGTTTATIMAGALVSEGINQSVKGVPVTRIIEGVKLGIKGAEAEIKKRVIKVAGVDSPLLRQIALVAGRENEDIAQLVIQAARLVGEEKLGEPGFKLAEAVKSVEGAESQVFLGILLNKERMNREMPKELKGAKVLIIDDALEPEKLEEEALTTESGFNKYLELQAQFANNIHKIVDLGVNLVLVDRGVDDLAEEILVDRGIMVVQRVANSELQKAAEHTGARIIKRTTLRKSPEELKNYLGYAEKVLEDEQLEQIRLLGGKGKPLATILVGAATEEVVEERERIAKDAASSVQAAFKGGVVAGGGSTELAISRELEKLRRTTKGMAAYGVDCLIEALKRPLAQIVTNAGFNALEAIGDVEAAQAEGGKDSLGIDCDTGQVVDMLELGVLDPALVKLHALRAAGEVAEAILRINTIIKKRDEKSFRPEQPVEGMDF